jgi:tryptophan-rich sensory protein
MGYAAHLVWNAGGQSTTPLLLFCAQLLLNWMWSPVFFGLRNTALALAISTALWGLVAATTVQFFKQSQLAGCLMIPYLMWLTLATALNWRIYRSL